MWTSCSFVVYSLCLARSPMGWGRCIQMSETWIFISVTLHCHLWFHWGKSADSPSQEQIDCDTFTRPLSPYCSVALEHWSSLTTSCAVVWKVRPLNEELIRDVYSSGGLLPLIPLNLVTCATNGCIIHAKSGVPLKYNSYMNYLLMPCWLCPVNEVSVVSITHGCTPATSVLLM